MVQFARDVSESYPAQRVPADRRAQHRRRPARLRPLRGGFLAGVKDGRGQWAWRVFDRYPKASWRNLNINVALLGAGPEGPVATARFEALREGVEECEARIVIEQALSDGKLPDNLAVRCRELIAERNRAIVMGLSPHKAEGFLTAAATGGSTTGRIRATWATTGISLPTGRSVRKGSTMRQPRSRPCKGGRPASKLGTAPCGNYSLGDSLVPVTWLTVDLLESDRLAK